eukprot:scaffold1075_cov104-Cylindrotheca_fusiformis.AAC.1
MPYGSSDDDDTRSATSKKSQFTQQSIPSSSGGRSGSSSETTAPREVFSSPSVGKREEANVMRARGLVALILLLAVSGVATAANLLVKQQERSDFENQFEAYATQVLTVAQSKADQFTEALDSFASSIGAHAAVEHARLNTSWPFYTIPAWAVQAEKLLKIADGDLAVAMAHIVQEDQRDQWNSYTAEQNPLWYQESVDYEGYTGYTADELINNSTIPFLHFYDPENGFLPSPVTRPGEALPFFQTYPIGLFAPTLTTNLDALQASDQVAELYNIMK